MEYSAPGLSVLTKTLARVPYGNGQSHMFFLLMLFLKQPISKEKMFMVGSLLTNLET